MAQIVFLGEQSDRSFFSGCSCAFGVFDGVHLGHRYLIGCARESALADGRPSVVLTFSIDPDELFAADRLMKLMSNEERVAALAQTGADYVAVLPFDQQFAALEPAAFLDWTFDDCVPHHVHVGEGFRFGRRALGTPQDLRAWGRDTGLQVNEHQLLTVDGRVVSSTLIRELISSGHSEQSDPLWKTRSVA
ncbi:MAG: hypothetical protein ACI4OC_01570 [Coriobacteriales bacterium]